VLGVSAGLLISALFNAVAAIYRHDPAATVNIAGLLFGLGSFTMALMLAGTFNIYTVPSILILLSFVPGLFAGFYARTKLRLDLPRHRPTWKEAWSDFRSPTAILFALLLFFQFGNEWSVAGWLPIFLVQRLGLSPARSLLLLALYWLALVVGRVAAQFLLLRFRHTYLLTASVVAALFGCVVLSLTTNVFGAVSGILFLGGGFAMVYPLVVEKIGIRFPYFQPTLFNGIFSFAMLGGLLAPWSVGIFADLWGIGVAMMLPLLGTCMVFLLLSLIWLETKLSGRGAAR
jgi:FHS family glucose/mannose:H+ symporter-like MFS transporter